MAASPAAAPPPTGPATPPSTGVPAGRYGRTEPGRHPLRPAAIVCAVLAAVGFGWVAWGMLAPQADADVARFEVIDATQVDLVLEVTRPIGATATCTIEALGDGFAQVGVIDVEIDPASTAVSQVPLTVTTSAQARVAVVRGCRL